jgi:hypothetical protein
MPTPFLADVADAEGRTPLPAPPPPPPDPGDAKYAAAPETFEADRQAAADAAAAFTAAATARGSAVAGVVARWLASSPLGMLQELLDQPADEMPIFKPRIGPAIVMRHAHVIKCLTRTDLFSVDPYAGEMARATDDKTKHPGAYSHFLLGTDHDELYRLDDVLLRRVMCRSDESVLAALSLADPDAVAWALAIVGERRMSEAFDAVVKALEARTPEVRDSAIGALVALGDPRAVQPLAKLAEFSDHDRMRMVIEAVSAIGGRDALEYLEFIASGHPDDDIKQRAEAGIAEIQQDPRAASR